jgi:hypothetical protein
LRDGLETTLSKGRREVPAPDRSKLTPLDSETDTEPREITVTWVDPPQFAAEK